MSKQAFDKENQVIIEAQYDTEKKRYFCPNPHCNAEMHPVRGAKSSFFSAYKDKKHIDDCPYRKYSDGSKTKIPDDFNLKQFYECISRNQVNVPNSTASNKKLIYKRNTDTDVTWVGSLSSLSRFCISHDLETPIDDTHTIDTLCISSSNVYKYWNGYEGIKLIIGKVLLIAAYEEYLIVKVESKQTHHYSQIKLEVKTSTAFEIINKVKKKYAGYHNGFTAAILCHCVKHKDITTYIYNDKPKTYKTNISGIIPTSNHVYIF